MWPVLRDGDVVFGKKVTEVHKNDIVVAKHPLRDMLVIKEVVTTQNGKIELRGRDEFGEDSRSFGLINHSAILAKIL